MAAASPACAARAAARGTASSASAVAPASPTTAASTARWRPTAPASRSTWTTRAPGASSVPWRVVHWLSAAPNATTTSDSESSRAASGDAKPPAIPSAKGSPRNSPLATADVASSAPMRSPSARSAGPAPASTAPRPAISAGRSAAASRPATRSTDAAGGHGTGSSGPASGGAPPPGASIAATSSGSMSTTARRSTVARRTARVTSATAVAGEWTRSATAPTAVTSAVLVDAEVRVQRGRGRVGGEQDQGRAALGRLGEAGDGVGQPRPLVDAATAKRPDTRAYPSAMQIAPPS